MIRNVTLLCLSPLCLTAAAQVQNALDFDGINDEVTVANGSAQIANAAGFSMTCWVYPTQNANWPNMEAFAGFRDNTFCDFYLLQTYGTTLEGRLRNSANTVFTVDSTGLLTLNTWQHLALTYDGSQLALYHNGVSVGSVPANGLITTTAGVFRIGNMPIPGSTEIFLDGMVDEVTLWSRGLTAAEVACIMNYNADPTDTDLKLYYRMDQGITGGTNTGLTNVIDATGHQNGVASGLALTGASSNWVAGSPVLGTNSVTICSGETYTLGGQQLTTAGTYSESFPTAGGCDSVVVLNLAVTPVNVGVVQNNFTLIAQASPASWQWVNCDNGFAPVQGATQQFYTATANGNYAVIVQQSGCADTSVCLAVTTVGLDEHSRTNINTWFDEQADALVLDLAEATGKVDAVVLDAVGRSVLRSRFQAGGRVVWPMSSLSPGAHLVVLSGDGVQHTVRFMRP